MFVNCSHNKELDSTVLTLKNSNQISYKTIYLSSAHFFFRQGGR